MATTDDSIKKNISQNITKYREKSGLSQKELASRLHTTPSRVSNWEQGANCPTIDMLFDVCKILNVSINDIYGVYPETNMKLSYEERQCLEKYRNLDDYGRQTVDIILDRETARVTALSERDDRIKALETEQSHNSIPRRIFAYYGKIAAAGTWVDFSDLIAGTKEYYLTDENANADYTIGVNGDSMEPTYNDGDIVFVKSANHLNVGDIGIFQKDNSIYIKEVGENGLISHNQKKYPPMIDGGDVRCWGKVVGKVTEDMIIND